MTIASSRPEPGWFPKALVCQFLGVSAPYFDRDIRPLLRAEDERRNGNRLLIRGAAVHQALVRKAVEASRRAAEDLDHDPLLADADSPALERYRLARARMEELKLDQAKANLVPREQIRTGLGVLASILRRAGEVLQRAHGPAAYAVLEEAYEEYDRAVIDIVGQQEQQTAEGDAAPGAADKPVTPAKSSPPTKRKRPRRR